MRRHALLPRKGIAPIAAAGLAVLALLLLFGAERANAGGCQHTDGKASQISIRDAKKAVICLINKKRANHGVRQLEPNGDLNDAARKHSRHMQRHGCFSHECPGEPDLGSRLRRSG